MEPVARPSRARPAGGGRGRTGGIFLCTSGTTGTPKGILLRDDQLAHVAAAVAAQPPAEPGRPGLLLPAAVPRQRRGGRAAGDPRWPRAALVLDGKFSRRGFWPLIEQRQITWINAVPAIITVLAMDPAGDPDPGRDPVRPVGVGAAAARDAAAVRGRVRHPRDRDLRDDRGSQHDHRQPGRRAAQGRLGGPTGRRPGPGGRGGPDRRTVGRAGSAYVPGRAGSAYVPCPAGVVGRVQIRGRGVIRQYAQGGPAGAIDPDGWLDTGDLGHLDQDGYLFLAGRSDDVINRGGEKIYPEGHRGLPAHPARGLVRRGGRGPGRGARGAPGRLRGPGRAVAAARDGRRRSARPARRACRGRSGRPRSAWSRSCRWVPPARSRGAGCGTAATRIWSTAQGRDDRRQAPPFVPLKDQTAGEAVVQPFAWQSAQPTTCPVYADISGKCHGPPPLMVENLRFVESFVDHSTHNHPIS